MTATLVPGLCGLPPKGHLLLITDELSSPADFILHRALALYLKHPHNPAHHVLLVSFVSEFAHWQAIASKSNLNLVQNLSAGSLTYIDALSISAYPSTAHDPHTSQPGYITCPPLFTTKPPSLKILYNLIAQSISHSRTTELLIFDDISLLELIGIPPTSLSQFIRALRALCHRHNIPLLLRAHITPSSSPSFPFDSPLLKTLLTTTHTHIEVRPLASGRSGAVSGEIALHIGPEGLACPFPPSDDIANNAGMGRKASVQYRLNDGGAVFFQKGMGAGVL